MTAEIQVTYARSGATLHAVVHAANSGSLAWNRPLSIWVNYNVGSFGNYALPPILSGGMASHGGSLYHTDFPQGIVAGTYNVVVYDILLGDRLNPGQGHGTIEWRGESSGSRYVASYSEQPTSGLIARAFPTQMARSHAVNDFMLYFKSSTDHITPFLNGVVSGQISRDGGLFGPLQSGAYTEVGNGFYSLMGLTSGDLNSATASLLFTATSLSGGVADPLVYSLILQRN